MGHLPLGDIIHGQIGIGEDGGQNIVKIVGDAASQSPHCFQPLGLAQLPPQFNLQGHIPDDTDIMDHLFPAIADGRDGHINIEQGAIFASGDKPIFPNLSLQQGFDHVFI